MLFDIEIMIFIGSQELILFIDSPELLISFDSCELWCPYMLLCGHELQVPPSAPALVHMSQINIFLEVLNFNNIEDCYLFNL